MWGDEAATNSSSFQTALRAPSTVICLFIHRWSPNIPFWCTWVHKCTSPRLFQLFNGSKKNLLLIYNWKSLSSVFPNALWGFSLKPSWNVSPLVCGALSGITTSSLLEISWFMVRHPSSSQLLSSNCFLLMDVRSRERLISGDDALWETAHLFCSFLEGVEQWPTISQLQVFGAVIPRSAGSRRNFQVTSNLCIMYIPDTVQPQMFY